MNFDTYKIKDELLEIYSGSEETFCVEMCIRDSIHIMRNDWKKNRITNTHVAKN